MIRPPIVAGYFYPKNKEKLNSVLEKFLKNVEKKKLGKIKAILVPHAGYEYSGQVAAHSYKQLDGIFKKIFILASNHSEYAYYKGASVPRYDFYETPLGKVKVSAIINGLLKNKLFTSNKEAHMTHIIEVQLPFLQKVLKDFEIIPIILSGLSYDEQKEVANILEKYLDENSLIVVSSDLSHFYPYETAVELDKSCLEAVERQNIEEVKTSEACGLDGMLILLEIAKKKGWGCKILEYKNSGDTSGDKSSVVGYGAVAFFT